MQELFLKWMIYNTLLSNRKAGECIWGPIIIRVPVFSLSYKNGLIGGEVFLHTDRPDHPDNNYQIFGRIPDKSESIERHAKMITAGVRTQSTVNISNYVSVLRQHLFPDMEYAFLHSGIRKPSEWGQGGDFSLITDIFRFDPEGLLNGRRSIASTDLDIFGPDENKKRQEDTLDALIRIGKMCYLVMAFTSPGFVFADWASEYGGRYAEGVFDL